MQEQQTSSEQKLPPFAGEIKFMWRGRETTLRLTSERQLLQVGPTTGLRLLHNQISDLAEMNFMAMAALAEDLYSRAPQGSREFEKFIQAMGLKFGNRPDDEIPVAK